MGNVGKKITWRGIEYWIMSYDRDLDTYHLKSNWLGLKPEEQELDLPASKLK